MRNALTTVSLIASFLLYWPLYKRILTRRSTTDFSKPAQWMILFLQFNNLTVAAFDHSMRLVVIYSVNAVLVAGVLVLIYKFYGETK